MNLVIRNLFLVEPFEQYRGRFSVDFSNPAFVRSHIPSGVEYDVEPLALILPKLLYNLLISLFVEIRTIVFFAKTPSTSMTIRLFSFMLHFYSAEYKRFLLQNSFATPFNISGFTSIFL